MACATASPVAQQTSKQRVDINNWYQHRQAEVELMSLSSGEPSFEGAADITRMELDIEKSSLVADEPIADIEEEELTSGVADKATADIKGELTSAWVDEAHQPLGVPLAHRMADEATATVEASIFTSKIILSREFHTNGSSQGSAPSHYFIYIKYGQNKKGLFKTFVYIFSSFCTSRPSSTSSLRRGSSSSTSSFRSCTRTSNPCTGTTST